MVIGAAVLENYTIRSIDGFILQTCFIFCLYYFFQSLSFSLSFGVIVKSVWLAGIIFLLRSMKLNCFLIATLSFFFAAPLNYIWITLKYQWPLFGCIRAKKSYYKIVIIFLKLHRAYTLFNYCIYLVLEILFVCTFFYSNWFFFFFNWCYCFQGLLFVYKKS